LQLWSVVQGERLPRGGAGLGGGALSLGVGSGGVIDGAGASVVAADAAGAAGWSQAHRLNVNSSPAVCELVFMAKAIASIASRGVAREDLGLEGKLD